jgi:hypothetical protein
MQTNVFQGTLTLVVGLALFCLAPGRASAQVVDQEQPVIDTTVGDMALGGYYGQQLAQVFTAGRTGLLAAVEFPLECGSFSGAPTGAITLEVRDVVGGVPGETVLATTMFDPIAFPNFWPDDFPPYLRRLPLSTATAVTAGLQYAVVLRFATENDTFCGVSSGPEGDSYPAGDGSYRENGPYGWSPLGSRQDLPFRTLMQEETRTSVLHKDRQWICIDRSSLSDHLGHGDTVWASGCRR